jgi:2',3'-cyclic-nucleotide 2'-phosphodiesterase (5'-nucleotidase family)
MDQKYRVVTNSFIARGGDGYSVFLSFANKADTKILLADACSNYIKSNSPIEVNSETRFQFVVQEKK